MKINKVVLLIAACLITGVFIAKILMSFHSIDFGNDSIEVQQVVIPLSGDNYGKHQMLAIGKADSLGMFRVNKKYLDEIVQVIKKLIRNNVKSPPHVEKG